MTDQALTSDALRELPARVIFGVSGINAVTARGWIAKFALQLGDRETRTSGYPRYGLADAAAVLMLDRLVNRMHCPREFAIEAANVARPYFLQLADWELAAIDDANGPPASPRWIMHFSSYDASPVVARWSDLQAKPGSEDHRRGLMIETRIELREIVRMARDLMIGLLGYSTACLSHDFAEDDTQ